MKTPVTPVARCCDACGQIDVKTNSRLHGFDEPTFFTARSTGGETRCSSVHGAARPRYSRRPNTSPACSTSRDCRMRHRSRRAQCGRSLHGARLGHLIRATDVAVDAIPDCFARIGMSLRRAWQTRAPPHRRCRSISTAGPEISGLFDATLTSRSLQPLATESSFESPLNEQPGNRCPRAVTGIPPASRSIDWSKPSFRIGCSPIGARSGRIEPGVPRTRECRPAAGGRFLSLQAAALLR